MATLSTQPYKGTRDFYPEDMRVRQWMFGRIRACLLRQGYEEYDGPMLEPFELYATKTSEEIVNEQLYWLMDRGERKMAIRPEMTPTLARMVAAKQNELPRPLRWFSIPNLWRYERPQRGRLREHWQLNVDVFGGSPLAEDVELLSVITALMGEFGAPPNGEKYEIRINHRGLTNTILNEHLKVPTEKTTAVCALLDGGPKMGEEKFRVGLAALGLDTVAVNFLSDLVFRPETHGKLAQSLGDNPHYQHLLKITSALSELGIEAAFRFDPSIMRGFMYYTGLVLEVFDKHPDNNRALFGGGRYDNLVGMFGGAPLPGVGFGMGDVTFRNFLECHGLLPTFKDRGAVYISVMEENLMLPAQKLAAQIRAGLAGTAHSDTPVFTSLSAEKPKKAFPSAEKLGARFLVFVGSDDVASGSYQIKDLPQRQEHKGDGAQLARFVVQAPALT